MTDFTAFLALEPDSIIMSYSLRDFPVVGLDKEISASDPMSVMAYPNPFKESLKVRLDCNPNNIGHVWTMQIMDLTGRKITSNSGVIQQAESTIDLTDVSGQLTQGIYILKVQVGSQTMSMRIVKE